VAATNSQAGMTLVEVVIVVLVTPILLGAAFMAMRGSSNAHEQASSMAVVTEKLRTTLRRVSDELRLSSVDAEDVNTNSALDAGEDLNNNGRLESDWAISTSSVTFNRMLPNGTYSLPITYRLNGTNLEREWMTDASGTRMTSVIATSVTSFTVLMAASKITIGITVSVNRPGGVVDTESSSVSVLQRN